MRSESGFTLIETLATLSIAGVLSVLLIGGLSFSGGAFTRSTALADAASDIYAAQSTLRRIVSSASNGAGGARFAGSARGFALTTRFAFPGAHPEATEADLSIAPCKREMCLTLSLARGQELAVTAPLVRRVAAVRMAYLGEEGWTEDWPQKKGAPRLVRIDLVFPHRDPRRWPPLYLSPGGS